jgi:hypothetical protein
MSLHVIGAGFGRTGTMSLKFALEELGLRPCYHMMEVLQHPGHAAAWDEAAREGSGAWRRPLAHYRAAVDWPAVYFWRDLAAAYPEAKLILTLRPAADWYGSASATIFARMREYAGSGTIDGIPVTDPHRRAQLFMACEIVLRRTFSGDLSESHATAIYEAHNEQVRANISPERLLVYAAGDGWEPLCRFLGLPVPARAYPKVNTTEDFRARFPPPKTR